MGADWLPLPANFKAGTMDEKKQLASDLERLRTIREQVGRGVKSERWHQEHTDRIKLRVDETAKKLGL